MKTILVLLVSILSFQQHAMAHGERQYGPHGGYIRMPGAFHTEIKIENDTLLVYLIDISFKNPMTKDSSLKAEYKESEKKVTEIKCRALELHFTCELPKKFNPQQGSLLVTARRGKAPGRTMEYPLPLKLLERAHH